MSNNTQPLYALTPITDTEGLENGKWYIVKTTDGDAHEMLFDGKEWHGNHEPYAYLRPLPEGTVAVSEEDMKIIRLAIYDLEYVAFNYNGSKLSDLKAGLIESTCPAKSALISARNLSNLLTKLAQMGE